MNTIIENNKLILQFLGYKLRSCNNGKAWESPSKYAIEDKLDMHGRLDIDALYTDSYIAGFHKSIEKLFLILDYIEAKGTHALVMYPDYGYWLCDTVQVSDEIHGTRKEYLYEAIIFYIKNLNK